MSNKASTLFYHEWADLFREMSAKDAQAILLALLDFDATGKKTEIEFENNIISAIYKMMLEKTEKNHLLYVEKCQKLAKNGALGGRPKKTEKAKKADRKGMEGNGMEGKGLDRIGMEGSGNNSTTPTLAQVKQFCADEGLSAVDPDRFWNYYESKNWLIDGEPMNWQARIRVWDSQDGEAKQPKAAQTEFQNFHQRDNNWAKLEEELLKK